MDSNISILFFETNNFFQIVNYFKYTTKENNMKPNMLK